MNMRPRSHSRHFQKCFKILLKSFTSPYSVQNIIAKQIIQMRLLNFFCLVKSNKTLPLLTIFFSIDSSNLQELKTICINHYVPICSQSKYICANINYWTDISEQGKKTQERVCIWECRKSTKQPPQVSEFSEGSTGSPRASRDTPLLNFRSAWANWPDVW